MVWRDKKVTIARRLNGNVKYGTPNFPNMLPRALQTKMLKIKENKDTIWWHGSRNFLTLWDNETWNVCANVPYEPSTSNKCPKKRSTLFSKKDRKKWGCHGAK